MKALRIIGKSPYYTNTYMLFDQKGHSVVFDPAADSEQYIEAALKENASIDAVFLTHGHFDHTYGLVSLLEKTNACLYASKLDLKGTELFPVTASDYEPEDDSEIRVGELTIKCWHTPGHSEGSFCYLCQNLFITGDTLFAASIGRTDLPFGDLAKMEASLNKIKSLPIPPDVYVLPGHGDLSELGHELKYNPYITGLC